MKALLYPLCLLILLLVSPGSGAPCKGESYQVLRKQCVLALQQRVKAMKGDLTQNCRDFVTFATCLKDSWNASFCGNSTDTAWKSDALLDRMEKKYFPDCLNSANTLTKDCDPDRALQTFILCGNRLYNALQNSATVSLTSVCPHVNDYEKCAQKSELAASCSSRYRMAPDIRFIADGIIQRYRLLCTALSRTALQKGTAACNRKRLINDMFLCGFHFAKILEVARKNSSVSPCLYIEQYKKCYNTSLETHGCAPSEQLHKEAEKFFEFLTEKFTEQCKEDSKSPSVARVSLLTDKDATIHGCNGYKLIGHFLQCSSDFMNATGDIAEGTVQACWMVGFYQRCMSRARQGTHCEIASNLNSHLASMEKSVLGQHPSICAASRNQAERGAIGSTRPS